MIKDKYSERRDIGTTLLAKAQTPLIETEQDAAIVRDFLARLDSDKQNTNGTNLRAAQSSLESEPGTIERGRARLGLREVDAAELAAAGVPSEPESLPLLDRDGYIIKGWSQIIAGYPKAGKTELVFSCVREWIDEGIPVLWLSEESEAVWQQRLSRYEKPPQGAFKIVFAMGADPKELLKRAASGSEDAVVVDTIRNLLQLNDENDNSEVARKLGQWEAALRDKTRVYIHHVRKGGGEHGHAIAGAGALLGVVDRSIEIDFDQQSQKRRKLTVLSRIAEAPELMYELRDGSLVALGDPEQVGFVEVRRRILEALGDIPRTTNELIALLGEPKPSRRQTTDALNSLFAAGEIERNPREERRGATYRWNLPKSEPGTALSYSARLGLDTSNGLEPIRSHVLSIAEECGWTGIALRSGVKVIGGEDNWRNFAATASHEDLNAVLAMQVT